MRTRPHGVAASLLLVGGVCLSAQQGTTASNSLASSTAVHRATTVTGATMLNIDYAVSAGLVTAVSPRLRGTSLLTRTVTARFGADSPVVCTAGPLTLLDSTTGLGEATYSCTGLLEPADRPRLLSITAS